jgi:7-cyano-7-deazaguanine synthase
MRSAQHASSESKIVVLLGGGIDSSVVVDLLRRRNKGLMGVHFNYGQPALRGERRAVRAIAHRYGVPVRWRNLGPPVSQQGDEFFCRNALFILATAAELGFEPLRIVTGIHAQSPYYDCSAEFLTTVQRLLDGHFHGRIVVETPLLGFSKSDVVAYARKRRLPLQLTYSCTRSSLKPCQECPSCLDRRALGVP